MGQIKNFGTFNESIIDKVSNYIWKNNNACKEIFDYIRWNFKINNLKYLKDERGPQFFYLDKENSFILKIELIDVKIKIKHITEHDNELNWSRISQNEFNNTSTEIQCSPRLFKEIWEFFSATLVVRKNVGTDKNIENSISNIRKFKSNYNHHKSPTR